MFVENGELQIHDTSAAHAKSGDRFTISDLGLDMHWLKSGVFMMGFKVKGKQHNVKLSRGFCLGKYEVTQAQGGRVRGNNPSNLKGTDRPVEEVAWNEE